LCVISHFCREQREVEIRDWKKKNAVDEKLLADSVDVSDRQPVFLKDKGDALYKQGNYRWGGVGYLSHQWRDMDGRVWGADSCKPLINSIQETAIHVG
jgi:hypothetical protein